MIAIAEVKLVIPQGDPHNYDDETQEYHPHIEKVPTPKAASV
jgi:molybdopterin-containing oxidoreductase family membrane subunit